MRSAGREIDEASGLPGRSSQLAVDRKLGLQHLANPADLRGPQRTDQRVEQAHRLLVVDLRPQQHRRDAQFLHRCIQREELGQSLQAQILQPAHVDDVADDADEVDVVGANGEVERDLEGFCGHSSHGWVV